MGRIVVVGAGLAGLVAAEALATAGRQVLLLEASGKAGGRCRSYRDDRLDRRIDNGNHLILTANRAVLGWADRIGGATELHTAPEAAFPFHDLADGVAWTLRMNPGPWGALGAAARPPGVSLARMAGQGARLLAARRGVSVAQALPDRGPLWRAFWDPMTRAVLNADPVAADAGLLRAAMLRSFARGAADCRPVLAPAGLGSALIDPALARLAALGVTLHLRSPVQNVARDGDRVTALHLRDGPLGIGAADAVILALPSQAAAAMLPEVTLPGPGPAIANAHFLVPDNRLPPIVAVLGGAAQWLFQRGDVVSVTVSAVDSSPIEGLDRAGALARLWDEVARVVAAHGGAVPCAMPPARFLRERAATFDQSPAGVARRHPTRTRWRNLMLAGDHVATGLPATLEGAVLSGEAAAAAILGRARPANRGR